ncbi:MAG: dihydrofolate reductase family protein [Chitinophaga sp.]|uniref:dihydrofolate reductase family protein n=1 Tax=Chitinophaga sp. TaxID=1869181 RepID=UPI0025BA8761|nr:dihydrofolate reductase family protein [Chitinophaga sp.]MBV8255551.1 dihydrofolate reductase family protein [Chitinophaga sp.]
MHAKLIFVSSLDGKITHWDDPIVKKWSSSEDKRYFEETWDKAPVIVIGSRTFDVDPISPTKTHLLVVMTSHPEKYQSYTVAGQLEFTSASPEEIFHQYEQAGYQQMLVAGGAHVATSFLKAKLIDELWLTVEPKIFGHGSNFVADEPIEVELELLSSEKVNERGTLINKYRVLK